MKFDGFHKIRQISHEIWWISCKICQIAKDQLPGMVSPMFIFFRNLTKHAFACGQCIWDSLISIVLTCEKLDELNKICIKDEVNLDIGQLRNRGLILSQSTELTTSIHLDIEVDLSCCALLCHWLSTGSQVELDLTFMGDHSQINTTSACRQSSQSCKVTSLWGWTKHQKLTHAN